VTTTSVDNVFPVRLMVLSRQIGIRSSETVIKAAPALQRRVFARRREKNAN
jgi:hypothetical protein